VGSRAVDAVKLYCIIRTAKDGNHASCSAQRGSAACQGMLKVYNYEGPLPSDVTADPRVRRFMDYVSREQEKFEKPKGDAPKTLFEAGRRAGTASRQGLRNARGTLGGSSQSEIPSESDAPPVSATPLPPEPQVAQSVSPQSDDGASPNRIQRAGSAVGGFTRKSYRCVRSLFRNCGEETSDAEAQ
jgi:hypothetical protein